MGFKIGVQVYSVRDYAEKDFRATMQAIKAMGYDGVELAGAYGLSADEVKAVLSEVGLEAISAHVPLGEMIGDPDKTFAFYREIGCRFVAVPWLEEARRPGNPGFEETVAAINEIGAKAREYGLQLLYHNHDFEFVKVDGEYALDMLYRVIPAEHLMTEIDTCWVNVGGENPAEYVKKYTGRAPIVHLKDFYMEKGATQDDMYELIGVDKKANKTSAFEFRPVGHGVQKFPAIVEASAEAGAEWLVVEQDRPSLGLTSMESIDISRKYLRSIGL